MKTKTVLILIISVLFFILVIQNAKVVTFKIFFWQIGMSGIIMFFLIFLLGFVLGFIFSKILKKKRGGEVNSRNNS